jgi:hypothetical protein
MKHLNNHLFLIFIFRGSENMQRDRVERGPGPMGLAYQGFKLETRKGLLNRVELDLGSLDDALPVEEKPDGIPVWAVSERDGVVSDKEPLSASFARYRFLAF